MNNRYIDEYDHHRGIIIIFTLDIMNISITKYINPYIDLSYYKYFNRKRQKKHINPIILIIIFICLNEGSDRTKNHGNQRTRSRSPHRTKSRSSSSSSSSSTSSSSSSSFDRKQTSNKRNNSVNSGSNSNDNHDRSVAKGWKTIFISLFYLFNICCKLVHFSSFAVSNCYLHHFF